MEAASEEGNLRTAPPKTRLTLASVRWRALRQSSDTNSRDVFDELLDAIDDNGDVELIQSLIRRLGNKLQYLLDLQGLDAFHHAILRNNITAMRLFFNKHLFQQPHQPRCNPYLHVAASVGCLPAISLLLHERPGEFYQKASLEIPYHFLHANDVPGFGPFYRKNRNEKVRELNAETDDKVVDHDVTVKLSELRVASFIAKDDGKTLFVDSGFAEIKKEEIDLVRDNFGHDVEGNDGEEMGQSNEGQREAKEFDFSRRNGSEGFIESLGADSDNRQQESKPETSESESEERLNEEFMHRMCMEDPDVIEVTPPMTPLEHAARGGHLEAVETLLLEYPAPRQMSLLESAVVNDCPNAVHLLFQRKDPDVAKHGIHVALKEAIRRKLPDMIKLLVAHGADHRLAFNGLNCLHCMYSYTSGYRVHHRRMEGVLEATVALVDAAHVPVNVTLQLGSHPLYSIVESLTNDRDQFEGDTRDAGDVHLSVIQFLLESGADPNLDEERIHNLGGDDVSVTFGRTLFSSALGGFFSGLTNSSVFEDKHGVVSSFVRLLLESGARAEPPLTSTFHKPLVLFTHYAYHVEALTPRYGSALASTLLLMLRHGADVISFDFDWGFPVNHYFNYLARLPDFVGPAPTNRMTANSVIVPFILLDHMSAGTRAVAFKRIRSSFTDRRTVGDDESEAAVAVILSNVEAVAVRPVSLEHLARLRVWKSLERCLDRVDALPLPTKLITCMFEPKFYGIDVEDLRTSES